MKRLLAGSVVILVIFVAVLVFIAPPVSPVIESTCLKSGEACLKFPTITGANLPGALYTLPEDFEGEFVVVIVPFDEEQQINAETWLPFVQQIAADHPQLTYYNVPVFPDIAAPIRTLIRAGMSAAIRDETLRAITITVFLEDRTAFLENLNLTDTEMIRIFLLNAAGEVVWRGQDVFSPQQGDDLLKVLRTFLN